MAALAPAAETFEPVEIREEEDGSGKVISSSVTSLDAMVDESAEAMRKIALNVKAKMDGKPPPPQEPLPPPQKKKTHHVASVPDEEAVPVKKKKKKSFEEMMNRVDELAQLEEDQETTRREAQPMSWRQGFLNRQKNRRPMKAPPQSDFKAVEEPEVPKKPVAKPKQAPPPDPGLCVGRVKERRGTGRRKAGPPVVDMPARLTEQVAMANPRPPPSDPFDDPDAQDVSPDISSFRARRMRGQPDIF